MKLLQLTCNFVPNKILKLQQCSPCIFLSIQLEIKNNVDEIKQSSFQIVSGAACCTWWQSPFQGLLGVTMLPEAVTFFTWPIKILIIFASICKFWAIWYIVTSYNTMHAPECHFLARSIRLWKFVTTLPEGTRLLDFWAHYPTLPYPKLKNHYPSGPG